MPGTDLETEVLSFFFGWLWEVQRGGEGFVGDRKKLVVSEGGLGGLKFVFEDLERGEGVDFVVYVGVWYGEAREKGLETLEHSLLINQC